MEDYNFKGSVKDKTAFKTQRNYSVRVEFMAGWESHEPVGLLRGRAGKDNRVMPMIKLRNHIMQLRKPWDSRVRGLAEARSQRFSHYTTFPQAILSWGLS